MNFFNAYNLSPLVSSILFLGLGLFIYWKNKKSITNVSFFLVCFVTFWWQFSWFLLFSTQNENYANILVKIGYIGIIFIPITFFHYFLYFLDIRNKFDKWLIVLSYSVGAIFAVINITTSLLVDGFYKFYWGFYPKAGIIHPIYLLFLTLITTRILYILVLSLKAAKEQNQFKYAQLKFVLVAILFYVLSAVDFLVNYGIQFYPFGFIFIIIFVGIIAYTIVAYRLMDIKFVAREYSVYLFSLVSIIIPAIIVQNFTETIFPKYIVVSDLILLILSVSFFFTLKDYFYRLANKYFFSSLYDSSEVISGLSEKLRTTLDIEQIYQFVSDSIMSAFHAKALGILAYSQKKGEYVVLFNNGFELHGEKRFAGNKTLHHLFIRKNKPIVLEELKNTPYWKSCQDVIIILNQLGVEILAPLNLKDTTIGLIALAGKESGDMYNDEDLRVLKVIGAQVAIAMENAMLYRETKEFGHKLEKKVNETTRELRHANQKLIKLDEAKSEFISIASHQLRTPLTVIKGYVSMILENNFGLLDEKKKEPLEKVFASNERLIQLVENLLNISRIESGRLQFNYEKMNLEDMVDSVVEELAQSAKRKGLKLIWNRPDKLLPKVNIDDEKIRQVVMNLTDNAIKYTKQGTITVTTKLVEDEIEFCVSDSGMGIIPTDLPNLFQKFTRGTGTSLVHTEGTGLGLYVARQMIEAHQGKIWAESKGEGLGSKFCFRLPVVK